MVLNEVEVVLESEDTWYTKYHKFTLHAILSFLKTKYYTVNLVLNLSNV